MSKQRVIGDKVRTKQMTFMRDDRLVDKICPQIEVDGKFMCVSDKNSPSGMIECDTRQEARERGRAARDQARAVLGGVRG